jgi:putative ABC transport system permease protein
MGAFMQDLRFALRLLRKERGYAATVMLTLAVCIGANTAVFTIVHSVLLRPLPIADPDRIMLIHNSYPKAGVDQATNGVPDYFDRLRDAPAFEALAMFRRAGQTIGAAGEPRRLVSLVVTPSFFRLMRQTPYRGRLFTDADGEVGQQRKVVLTYDLWQQLFGGNDSAIGADVRIGGVPHTVVGVLPQGQRFVSNDVDLFLPAAFTAQEKSDDSRHSNNWGMLGRLRPGATREQAQAQIDAVNARNMDRFPQFREILTNAGFHTVVVGYQEYLVRDIRRALYLLWGGVVFVLLIGCVNLTNLTLARSTARVRELATRHALGARLTTIARQLLTETTLMTIAGGAIGLGLGSAALRAMTALGLRDLPRGTEIRLDWTVAVVTTAASVIIGVGIGLFPVLTVRHLDLAQAFRDEGRAGTASRRTQIVRRAMVASQVAFALVLLMGAALLLTSFRRVLSIDPGFVPDHVLTGNVNTPAARYANDADLRAFVDRLLDRVRALPGVEAAALTTTIPFGTNFSDSVILAEGHAMKPGESLISPSQLIVSDGYFETMRIPLKRGRFFDRRDNGTERVIIVDEQLAQKFWPGADPIGRRMYQPEDPQDLMKTSERTHWLTVVGVVGQVKIQGLVAADTRFGAYYFPYAQSPARNTTLAIRTTGSPEAIAPAVRRELAAIDPELPLFGVQTMEARIDASLTDRRAPMMLAVTFAAIAVFLAAIGIYGVLAYQVRQRTREIGIRMALGGDARSVFGLVLRDGIVIVAIGLALGTGGAFALRRAIQNQLYSTDAMDPVVLTGAAVLLAATVLAACAVPARRAASIDPVVALADQ